MLGKILVVSLSCALVSLPALAVVNDKPANVGKPAAAAKKPAAPKLAPSNLTVAQIVEKNVAARGGLKNWQAVKTLSMTGKMDAGRAVKPATDPQQAPQSKSMSRAARLEAAKKSAEHSEENAKQVQVPYTLEMKRPYKMRLEITFQGDTAVQVYDGEKGWKVRPFLGRREVEAYTADELKAAAQQTQLDGPLIDYAAKGYKVEVEGMDPVEGHDAYRLKVTLKDGQVRHVWVDAKSYLDVKIDETRQIGGKARTIVTTLRDFKAVEGLKIPHLLETTVTGAIGLEKIYVERVAVNPKLEDVRFAKLQ